MVQGIVRKDIWFLLACVGLAIVAELGLFRGPIGISYLIFIVLFFTVFYIRFKGKLTNKRMGLLIISCILLITGSYGFHDKVLFSELNLFVVLVLSLLVVVLMTGPANIKWESPILLHRVLEKLLMGIVYSVSLLDRGLKLIFKNMEPERRKAVKQTIVALLVAIPLLAIVMVLLMSADSVFEDMIMVLPTYLLDLNFGEIIFRTAIVVVLAGLYFGVFQVLKRENPQASKENITLDRQGWGTAFGFTILLLLNLVYILFVIIQFKYFFSGNLQDGFTYADYARRGFFELLAITIINWTILVTFLKKIKLDRSRMKFAMKIMYSILIAVSSIMLVSAFLRLSMYEQAYGFTFDRVQAHAVMIFLFVIFTYTFIHIWLEGLRMTHFYFLFGLLFFTGMNVFHVEEFIAEKNWERYEETGKMDVFYLNNLASAGTDVLIRLFETDPNHPDLDMALEQMVNQEDYDQFESWQSFNLAKYKTIEKMKTLDFKNE